MVTDEQLLAALEKYPSIAEAARQLDLSRGTIYNRLNRIRGKRFKRSGNTKPKLTQEILHQAIRPPNTCRVATFREQLDPESLGVLDEALGYNARDFPASQLRLLLIRVGFPETEVPGVDAIQAHRRGQRPCRCKG